MRLINQSSEISHATPDPLQVIEQAGRTCYKSEDCITESSAAKFYRTLLRRGHESVLEHANVTVKFITNRGVSHELVRHRPMSVSQESTRYVRYSGSMEFVTPVWLGGVVPGEYERRNGSYYIDGELSTGLSVPEQLFLDVCQSAERHYRTLTGAAGWRPEQAREVLPNAVKTELVVTANVRQWRHMFKLRCSKQAHPQMRALMLECLAMFKGAMPVLFDDLPEGDGGL